MATKASEEYKFRISCKTEIRKKTKGGEFEFYYSSLEQARKNYKAILLGLYKRKDVMGFTIVLNRCVDRKWSRAIFKEVV